jgi:hypothetical protein
MEHIAMQSRGLVPLLHRHPIAGTDRSWLAGLAALSLGAFVAGGWVAAVAALFSVRIAQSVMRNVGRNAAGPHTPGLA